MVWAPGYSDDFTDRAYTPADFDTLVDQYCADQP
jgi:hypothetical protein